MKKTFYYGLVTVFLMGQLSAAQKSPKADSSFFQRVKRAIKKRGAQEKVLNLTKENVSLEERAVPTRAKKRNLGIVFSRNTTQQARIMRTPFTKVEVSPATKKARESRLPLLCVHKVAVILFEKKPDQKKSICRFCQKQILLK
jgi:tRNA(Ile2) C34 agmatinyltransferase TiaS